MLSSAMFPRPGQVTSFAHASVVSPFSATHSQILVKPPQRVSRLAATDSRGPGVSPFPAADPEKGEGGALAPSPTRRVWRRVAGGGARCHNPVSGHTAYSRWEFSLRNASYGG